MTRSKEAIKATLHPMVLAEGPQERGACWTVRTTQRHPFAERQGGPRYHLQGSDGAIGHVEDYIVDDETWEALRYDYYGRPGYWEGRDRAAGVTPPHPSESHPG